MPTYGKAWRGVLFRRTYPELEELMARARELYPQTGGRWNEQKKTWVWPNGATLKMRYCERDVDVMAYQGHQYTWIGWDELTQWPSLYCYRYLRSRLRSAHDVPNKRIRAAANPGGPGHLEVKSYFIDPEPAGFVPVKDEDTGLERMFVPARLQDNAILTSRDPEYIKRLKGLGSETLVRALLEGDWSIIDGAYFDCWSPARHIIRPFPVPREWKRFRSMDWGSAAPFSVGWWTICPDEYEADNLYGEPVALPRGALIRYREWYGAKKANVGLKMDAEAVGAEIVRLERGEDIAGGVADPAIFKQDGGPSIAEMLAKAGATFARADNTRVGTRGALSGWDQMRRRMRGNVEGHSMIFCFTTCRDSIRTIPVLQHDKMNPEDLDTDMEDHAADEWRYACNSRPFLPEGKKPKPKAYTYIADPKTGAVRSSIPFSEIIKRQERKAKRGLR